MTPAELLRAAATEDVDLGGVRFRVRRVTTRDLDTYRGYQLMLIGVPDAERQGLAETVREMVAGGANPLSVLQDLVTGALRVQKERLSEPDVQAAGEAMRAAILASAVTHWSVDGETWRAVRVVVDGADIVDGEPDVCPIRFLPGGAGGEEALVSVALRLSQLGEGEAARLARFRGGA